MKIAAGRIERDLAFCVYAEPDFITIDGRGGATGSSPRLLRDSASVPTIYALHRARKYLDSIHSDISLVITGGLRVSSDFAKAIAMGAGRRRHCLRRADRPGLPAVQDLRHRHGARGALPRKTPICVPAYTRCAAQRVANFLNVSLEELKMFARITGHADLHELSVEDLCTISREISEYTDIPHA